MDHGRMIESLPPSQSPRLHRLLGNRPDTYCNLCLHPTTKCKCTEADWQHEWEGWQPKKRDWREHDRPTSKGHKLTPTREEYKWRHSHWHARREKVAEIMASMAIGNNRFQNFMTCGAGCSVQWSESLGRHRIKGSFCKDRLCEPCQRTRPHVYGKTWKSNCRSQMVHRQETNAHTDFHLHTATHRAKSETANQSPVRCISQTPQITDLGPFQDGGVVMLEVKWSKTGWHPHLHAIAPATGSTATN